MTVWLCSGQGAQKPGMGADLFDIPEVSDTFSVMSDGLGIDLVHLAKEGTEEEVNDAVAAQALTMAVSVGIGCALRARGFSPDAVIGFSLGQVSALVLSDVLSLEDATALLRVRAGAMAKACAENPGGMVALMGATLEDAKSLCEQAAEGDVLVPANCNAPGQIVISGTNAALERAQGIWKEAGKRSVRLATAGAFHSLLMAQAASEVRTFCEELEFAEPTATIICNTDAKPFNTAEASARMGRQVETGVLFEQSVRHLLDTGETDFVEVGFGGVLNGLVRKIDKTANRTAIGNRTQFDEYVEQVGA